MAACWPRGGEQAAQAAVPLSSLPPLAEAQHTGRADAAEGAAPQSAADCCSNWYFSREFIDHCSPSRKDGIDLKQETFLRRSYSAFLQRLGKELHMPQLTIATAIVFCHRFFIRQSHAKNDRFVIATICMFLAGKVEETPERLNNVIFLSHEIIHSRDPAAAEKIKQKDVYEQQKEIMLVGERLVLATLGFELNVHHPYKPLVAAIKKFEVAQSTLSRLAQIAWNFVNDGLQTSLSLQFKPCHVAAGAIFLAAKFLKVKPPVEGEMFWRQEFKITPQQLEDVSNQLLEFYEVSKEEPAFQTGAGAIGYDYCVANNYQTSRNEVPAAKAQVAEARVALESHERDEGQHCQDKPTTSWPGYEEVHFSELEDASYRKESTMICEGSRSFEGSYLWKDEEEWRDKELGNGYYRQLDSKYQYNHSSCVEDDDTRYCVNPPDTYEADLLGRGSQQPAEHVLDMRRKDEYQEEIYYGHMNETQDFTYSLSKDVVEPTSTANPWLGYEDRLPRRDWKVLPESYVENGYRDDHLANTYGNVNNRKRAHYTSMDDDDWRSNSKSWINYEEEYPERGTKNGFRGDSLDSSYRSSYSRGYYHHQYRHERRADTRFDYQRHKMRGWQERDLKRARYEHVN